MRVWRRPSPRIVLAAAWLIVIVYAYPGYMNFDVGEQLYQVRTGKVSDYHPPIMGGYWRIFELFVTGPFPMLLLQTSLFTWGLYKVLRHRLDEYKAAWVTAAIILFPPVLTPMAVIWKDAQMSAFLMAGTALVLEKSRRARITGMVLYVVAAGVRFNAPMALPFLTIAAVWTAGGFTGVVWSFKRRAAALGIAAALTLGCIVAAAAINKSLTKVPAYNWYRTTAILDIVGTVCFAPPLTDAEVLDILDGVKLHETTNLQQTFCAHFPAGKGAVGNPPWYQYSEMFDWEPAKADRLARRRAWMTLVTRYPGAYLHSRMELSKDLLGIGDTRLWEPVGQDFAANEEHLRRLHHDAEHSWFQRHVGNLFKWFAAHTPLYRAYLYLILCLIVFGWASWKRDLLVWCLSGSALLYELSLAIGANAPDFRYSHWMISCTCIGLVFVALARYRSRTAPT